MTLIPFRLLIAMSTVVRHGPRPVSLHGSHVGTVQLLRELQDRSDPVDHRRQLSTKQHASCRHGGSTWTAVRRFAIASAGAFFIAVWPAAAFVSVAGRNSIGEGHILAACIHRAARGKPWLEATLHGLRAQEHGWIGAQIRNRDGSHDLGPMQVNSWWVRPIGDLLERPVSDVYQWLRDDACFNVETARWIFLSELGRRSDFWRAIGAYHSPVRGRQWRYALAVHRRIVANRLGSAGHGMAGR